MQPMKLPTLTGNHRYIEVSNCERFMVPVDALNDLAQLNILKFANISELMINENSFNSVGSRPSIRIEIVNCSVPALPQHFFKGRLDDILIKNSNISRIHMFALTGLYGEITNFKILDSIIGQVDTQAFRKLSIDNLEIARTSFLRNTLSKTFYDCHIKTISIEASRFTMLMSNAIEAKEVERLQIIDSFFGFIESEAFMLDVSDRAIFQNNTVEMMHRNAFKGETKKNFFATTHEKVFPKVF
jgi:hypothetical protein